MNEDFEQWINELSEQIAALWRRTERRIRVEQAKLSSTVLEYLLNLEYSDGKLIETSQNIAKLNVLKAIIEEFMLKNMVELSEIFASDVIDIAVKNGELYKLMGFDAGIVDDIVNDTEMIRGKLGVDSNGKIQSGGFLSQMVEAAAVKSEIIDYVVSSITSRDEQKTFLRGVQSLIKGRQKQTVGVLESFWTEYAYDVAAQVREVQNLKIANELGLEYFIYTGGLIDASRDFCKKKNGRVFSRVEAEDWVNDPDLIDKKTKDTYRPLIERGRYNCRHFLMWISEEKALELKKNGDANR